MTRLLVLVMLLVVPLRAEQPIGDCDASGSVTINDAMYLIQYIFNGGDEPRRTEWVEVDTTVSVVWILDRAFTTSDWPIRAQKHWYVFGVDTTWLNEVVIVEGFYPIFSDSNYFLTGKPLVRTK